MSLFSEKNTSIFAAGKVIIFSISENQIILVVSKCGCEHTYLDREKRKILHTSSFVVVLN